MGKALSGELSCPCDRSCLMDTAIKYFFCLFYFQILAVKYRNRFQDNILVRTLSGTCYFIKGNTPPPHIGNGITDHKAAKTGVSIKERINVFKQLFM